jgi:hypothetical protein
MLLYNNLLCNFNKKQKKRFAFLIKDYVDCVLCFFVLKINLEREFNLIKQR